MQLVVHVAEARGLRAIYSDGLRSPYVRLQIGKYRMKTAVIKKTLNPLWDEQFCFFVGDLSLTEKLILSVMDDDKCLGRLKVPLRSVLDTDNLSLGTTWYQLLPKSKKSKNRVCGEICLSIYLSQRMSICEEMSINSQTFADDIASNLEKSFEIDKEMPSSFVGYMESSPPLEIEKPEAAKEDKSNSAPFADMLRNFFLRKTNETLLLADKDLDSSEEFCNASVNSETCENTTDGTCSNVPYDELVKTMESRDQGGEMPDNLSGGVLHDKTYVVSPSEMNSILFSPNSEFLQSLPEVQGISGVQADHWVLENDGTSLKRVMTYTKAATKLIKSLKAIEEQKYLKIDKKIYAVLASVSTPDAPFGSCFKIEILYCITPGPELPSEQLSRLIISWRVNFIQSTMMKSMIENGAKQGLTESYLIFADLLSKYAKVADMECSSSTKEQILASLQTEQESIWKLSFRVFGNFTFALCALFGLYILIHILLANPITIQGLEFPGLDLPDSIGEIVVSVILVLQGQRLLKRIGCFVQAQKDKGNDHGIKAQGDGWLLTVVLIEGSNLAVVDSSCYSDPYVVFTCNGKTKTSSIKFQMENPQWNGNYFTGFVEIFEFDAMPNPPSRMDVAVYDFDGPFGEATSLGHAEVNFVKSNLSDLADVWIPLGGKISQACQSKLHLRIFLDNTLGSEVVTEYLTKMGKEMGKKINLRSPQTNSTFQKLFGLPPEEFLINDFNCHLKRKMPLQGRLFLSPRIIGFYTNLFGHKTKFFFLWEDIDQIQVIPPSLASVGSPSLMIILSKGRGTEAQHGAKTIDRYGRLKFQFQSFVYFNDANRTIMALWKAKSLSPEQKVKIVEESEARSSQTEENGSFLGIEDAKMLEVFSSSLPVSANKLMEIFDGSSLECMVMKKIGFREYSPALWQPVKSDVCQRQIRYKFDKDLFGYGGEVTSTQQRSCSSDRNVWVVEEMMTLSGVLLADFFNIQLKYQIDSAPLRPNVCSVQVSLGIAWLKNTKHQKRITKNVMSNSILRLKEMFRQAENALLQEK